MEIDVNKYTQLCVEASQKLVENLRINGRDYFKNTLNFVKGNKQNIVKLAIPFVIIGVGFYACSASHRTIKKNVCDIFVISDQIRLSYVEKPDYWGLSTDTVIKGKLVSDEFIKDGNIVLSNGLRVLIGSGKEADVVMPRTNSFDIVLNHLNKAECISYAEMNLSKENQTKLVKISISNTTGINVFEWGGINSLPVNKYASRDFCSDSGNTLIWTVQ